MTSKNHHLDNNTSVQVFLKVMTFVFHVLHRWISSLYKVVFQVLHSFICYLYGKQLAALTPCVMFSFFIANWS